jgi:PKD repeat protein
MNYRLILCLLLVVAMVGIVNADTLILYIDNTAQDGRWEKTCSGAGSWETCRDAASSTSVTTTTGNTYGPLIDVNVGPSLPNFSVMRRGAFIFNTSKIGNGNTVSSAVLSIAQNTKTNTFPVAWAIGVTTFSPASFTSLATSDYGKSSYIRVADDIPYDSIVNAGYNNWSLTNLTVVNVTGFTPLMTDINWSIDNTPPALSDNALYARFYMYDTSQSGSALDPFITITYTTGGGGSAPVASFTCAKNFLRIPNSVTCTDSSTNTPTSWSWNMGDGSAAKTTQNVTYPYLKRGMWGITLNATNAVGSNVTPAATNVRVAGYENNY